MVGVPRLISSAIAIYFVTEINKLPLGCLAGRQVTGRYGSVGRVTAKPQSGGSEVSILGLPFWLGIGAAQKSAVSEALKPSRHPGIALVLGTLIAVAIIAGLAALLAYEQ